MHDFPPLLFAAYRPSALIYNGNAIRIDADRVLKTPGRLQKGTVYFLKSDLEDYEGRPKGGKEDCRERGRYLQVPGSMSPRVRELARNITHGHKRDYEKAKAVEMYLKTYYTYSLDTMNREWKGDPVPEFLFELKKGHCELFATSMVMLLRHAGIPSRLVAGFPATRFDPFKRVFVVRERDAHAWVEAYIEDHGWVTFEPTPSYELPHTEIGAFYFFHFFDYTDDYLREIIRDNPEQWWVWVLDGLRNVVRQIADYLKEAAAWVKEASITVWDWLKDRGWWEILIAITIIMAGVMGFRKFRPFYLKWRLLRLRGGNASHFILRCYADMEKWFGSRGSPRPGSFTATEYQAFLKTKFPDLSPQVATITDQFKRVRYSTNPVTEADTADVYNAYRSILDYQTKKNR
jgi:transglutaminase-like putative cysteine protease